MPSLPRCPLITVTAGVTGYTAGMAKSVGTGRERGHIRKRGNSYQVLLYAGVDPLTGRELRMVESTTDRAEATRILNRMRAATAAARPRSVSTPRGSARRTGELLRFSAVACGGPTGLQSDRQRRRHSQLATSRTPSWARVAGESPNASVTRTAYAGSIMSGISVRSAHRTITASAVAEAGSPSGVQGKTKATTPAVRFL